MSVQVKKTLAVSAFAVLMATGITAPAFASVAQPAAPSGVAAVAETGDVPVEPPVTEGEGDLVEVTDPSAEPAPGKGPNNVPGADYCGPAHGYYTTTANYGKVMRGVGVDQANYNGTSRVIKSVFSAEASGEVGISVSGELKVSANALLANVEAKYGVDLSAKLTAKLGNTTWAETPPRRTTHARYGVWRLKTAGTSYTIYSNCSTSAKKTVVAYTPQNVGWYVWETA
ncbi:hypothetical protein ACIA8O_02830 [Kitasatospora sp. NPDC051853]|uniref:hypothetical protein n=1 Tax=Kitasatospora sp. NPDC051853 TaxID=3364058 RepID=UPI00379A16A3